MNENGLTEPMSLIKGEKWERLFKRRELMHIAVYKEFYKNLTISMSKKKEVARSSVGGVNIELDGMILAGILGIPRNNGICEYIKEVWTPSRYCNPLEITKKFANNDLIKAAKRVKSTEMKPFQRFLHFIVMKNVVPRFGKRDTTSFMNLTYMDHMLTRRLVNLPRVMMRHMSYVISVENHELPYGDWMTMVFEAFNVPLVDNKGKSLRGMISLKKPFSICANSSGNKEFGGLRFVAFVGEMMRMKFKLRMIKMRKLKMKNRTMKLDTPGKNPKMEIEGEEVHDEDEIQGESGSAEKFYDAEDEVQGSADVVDDVPEVPASVSEKQKETTTAGVNPSILVGSTSDSDFAKLQAEFKRARADKIQAELDRAQAENARLLALLQQAKSLHKP
ncbi:hypothetical protein Dimus_013103 [Dionaea muscipula]